MNTEQRLDCHRLLEVLSQSKNATAVYTTEDVIIETANDAMLSFWGKDRSIIGLPIEEGVPELKGQPFKYMLKQVLLTGITNAGTIPAETMVDGALQISYYEYEYRAVKDAQGNSYCVLHTAANVTDRVLGQQAIKQVREQADALYREQALNEELAAANEELVSTNEELQEMQQSLNTLNNELEERVASRTRDLVESEARFRAMAEGSGILIAVGDESSNATYFSKAWTDLTGRSMKELLQFGWVDLVHPEDRDRYVNIYLSAFEKRVPFTGEFRILSKEGDYRWLLANGPPRFRPDGSFAGYISSCVDITEQKELEQRKDDFISIASHELKTPITSLMASLQLMDKLKNNPSHAMLPKLIMQSRKSIQRVSTLVEDLLNVRRLQQGEMHLNKSVFIVSQLLNACCNIITISGKHKVEITGDLEQEVYADEHRIDQVVTNFINNAVKYAPESEMISLGITKEGQMLKVSVTDKGQGIPQDKLPHLFDRYYRVDASGYQVSGLGLGLYISAEIIRKHGGEIGADSELGRGSTFWFTLPLFD
jgi:two-component system sensor histidine kinase VicK